jgi:hypothetical protein
MLVFARNVAKKKISFAPSTWNYTFNIEMWGMGLFQFMCVEMLFLAQV